MFNGIVPKQVPVFHSHCIYCGDKGKYIDDLKTRYVLPNNQMLKKSVTYT